MMANGNVISNVFNYELSSQQFEEYVTLLFGLAKLGGSDVSDRMYRVEQLTEAYVNCRGERPNYRQLDRLSSLILRDELTDTNEHKMTHEEYPLLSDRQQERRHLTEVHPNWAKHVAQDGRDYQPKTRDYMRKLREIHR